MDVLTIALACSLYPDAALIETLVRDASRGYVYFVGDTVTLETYDHAGSIAEAQAIVARIQAAGGRPVVGLMGVPTAWAARFGKPPADLFDGCSNIAVGTAMLARYEAQCRAALQPRGRGRHRPLPRHLLRPCVLGRLGRELGIPNFVAATMRELSGQRTGGSARRLDSSQSTTNLESTGDRALFFDQSFSSSFPSAEVADTSPALR